MLKETFRNYLLDFFNNCDKCGCEWHETTVKTDYYQNFVETNLKKRNGKYFSTVDNRVIIAKCNGDKAIDG